MANSHTYNIDNIHVTPSPIDTRPRFFRPGLLFGSKSNDPISLVANQLAETMDHEEDSTDDEEEESNSELLDQNLNDPESKHAHEVQTARKALQLARTSVNQAMNFMKSETPSKFLAHSYQYVIAVIHFEGNKYQSIDARYLSTFKYVSFQQQRRNNEIISSHKEYEWPQSFPDCTPRLRK